MRFPLPVFPPLFEGDLLLEGHSYIYRHALVRAKTTAVFNSTELSTQLKVVAPYTWGHEYPQITQHFSSTSSLYDARTHMYLGKYLRLLHEEK